MKQTILRQKQLLYCYTDSRLCCRWYGDSACNTSDKNSSIFSLTRMY